MIKVIETIGTAGAIIGSFLVALKLGNVGYPFFLISSVCLLFSAFRQRQKNFIAMQGVFLTANIIGAFNYI